MIFLASLWAGARCARRRTSPSARESLWSHPSGFSDAGNVDVNRDAEIMGYQGPDYDTNVPPRGSGGYDNGNFY